MSWRAWGVQTGIGVALGLLLVSALFVVALVARRLSQRYGLQHEA